jgi:hypothetical protein
MLWFDNSKSSLPAKVRKAVDYYNKKYGRTPELCLIHPSMIAGDVAKDIDFITVRPYRPVLPGHMWIGIEDATAMDSQKPEPEHD